MKYVGQEDSFVLTADNYYSKEAQAHYVSVHDYLEHMGSLGHYGCEARGEAIRDEKWKEEDTTALLVGSYVDSYFEGTLDLFKKTHPQILTQKGELRSEYKRADKMIQRAEQDELFMRYMKGKKQVIMTGLFAGIWWKIKIDCLTEDDNGEPFCITDLKTTGKPLNYSWNVQDYGRIGFVEYWGYDFQMALYQEIYRINTGKLLPTRIAVITKEEEPDIAILSLQEEGGGNMFMENALEKIKSDAEHFKALISKDYEPIRCDRADCMYCRSTKKLIAPMLYKNIVMY